MKRYLLLVPTFLVFAAFSATISKADLSDGLVAYWPMDGDAKDMVGGNDGEVNGGPKWVSGQDARVGTGSLALDGVDDHILAGAFDPSEGTGQLTIALWVTLNEHKATMFVKKGDDWSDNGMMWQFEMDASGDLSIGRKDSAIWFGTIMPLKEWTHLAVTADGKDATLYVNGEPVDTGPFVMGTGTESTLRIAATQIPHRFVDGILDEVMLYNRVLEPHEIKKLAEGVNSANVLSIEPAGKLAATWARIKKQ